MSVDAPRTRSRSRRSLDLTEAHVARVARVVPEGALPSYHGYTPLSQADTTDLAARLLDDNRGSPFWVFAYGSLIWKPAFEHVEARRAVAHGWRRAYCIDIDHWRATPEEPGLMLALVRGGRCTGVAYRMPPDDPEGRMRRLLYRELAYHQDAHLVRWLTLRAGDETLRALTFYAGGVKDPAFINLPIEVQARRLGRAVGHLGSCAEYLRNTVEHLEEMGIRDSYLWTLQRLVAEDIAQRHPDLAPRERVLRPVARPA